MPKGDYLGEFEQIVLLALLHLGEDAYGMRVRQVIEERGERTVSVPTVYAALDRLERKEFVSSTLGEATPERGGRAKRYFRVEPAGLEAVRASRELFARMAQGIALDAEVRS